jgi:hypothetical protein
MKEKPYIIQSVVKRENEIVFWVGHNCGEKPEFGILFDEPYCNIARQEFAESIVMGWQFGSKAIMKLVDELPDSNQPE